mmetsp:Transcript_2715/g.7673  ORF Transcript_2715/g.7673 Transcript_2715/m.7673 type:complete len:99 (-) Transcript_2715:831-1127(-)
MRSILLGLPSCGDICASMGDIGSGGSGTDCPCCGTSLAWGGDYKPVVGGTALLCWRLAAARAQEQREPKRQQQQHCVQWIMEPSQIPGHWQPNAASPG